MVTVYAFRWVPDMARGFVRDLRVRWALEEADIPYRTHRVTMQEKDGPDYRAIQPFGQVPAYEEDDLVLFESGAIVLHIGEKSDVLLPKDCAARMRATQWLIAALNSVEPFVQDYAFLVSFQANEPWAPLRRPSLEAMVNKRLTALANALGDKPYLDGDRFTAGDLMMASVLRILDGSDIVASNPTLSAYLDRCIARPAFKRALDAQLADFDKAA